MISYRLHVREGCYFEFSMKNFIYLVSTWYSVVGTIFCSGWITCGATHAGRILFDTTQKRENSRVWPFEVRVMLLLDISQAWMILTGTQMWIACGYTTVVSHNWLAFFVTNLQLTQADDVFVYTSDRSRSMYYVDHLDPNLPSWGAVQGLYITDLTQTTCPRACSMGGTYPATQARSHRSGIDLPWKS